MTTATPPSRRSGRLKLLLLVAVFIVPILVAIVLNAGGWVPAPARQHGELLQPPIDLRGQSLALLHGVLRPSGHGL